MSEPAPALAEFGLPEALANAVLSRHGWVVVSGPGDCDEHALLAAILDHINGHRDGRIATVEKPIRHDIYHRRCVVTQREIGTDIKDTPDAYVKGARHAQRVDADVLGLDALDGEGALDAAMVAADAGLLVVTVVLGGDHLVGAFERLLMMLGKQRPIAVRECLSRQLVAWVHAVAVEGIDGERIVVREVLLGTSAVRGSIADGHSALLHRILSHERASGMRGLEDELMLLWSQRRVTRGSALAAAPFADQMTRRIDGATT